MARPKRRSPISKSNYMKGKKAKLECKQILQAEQTEQTEQTEQEPIMQPFESNVYDEEQVISDEEMDENGLDISETKLVDAQLPSLLGRQVLTKKDVQ